MSKGNKAIQLDKKGRDTLQAIMTNNTLTAAAQALGISRKALYDRIDKYQLKEIQESLTDSTMKKLMVATEKAADVMLEGLEDRRQRYQSAEKILDGMVFKRQQGPSVQVNNFIEQRDKDKQIFDLDE